MDFTSFNFSVDFSDTTAILLALVFATSFIALWARFLPILRAGKAVGEWVDADTDGKRLPKVSVIVYTITEEDEIMTYLEMAMNQDYPDYEIIMVNEGSYETTSELSERLRAIYPDKLYVTFIPSESQSLSRRKLAQTVGMKAAKGEIVITTMSNCSIPSRSWISEMAAPFILKDSTDVVLGYSHINFENLHGAGSWYRDMDSTLTACQWIGAAAAGFPYRGDGANLAFRRKLFFDNKGYAKTLHLMNGDDDLFLRQIIKDNNTAISISPNTILTSEWGVSGNRIHAEFKERYQFTSRFLPKWPFLRAGLGSAMQWGMLAAACAAAFAGLPSLVPAIIGIAAILITWAVEIAVYRKTAGKLESVRLWWSLPWFLLWHPISNLVFRIKRLNYKKKNYTFA